MRTSVLVLVAVAVAAVGLAPAAVADPLDTWELTHGIDCEGDPYNPDREPGGDPEPGSPEWQQRDRDNQECARQRASDRRYHPTFPTNAATYGQDWYRQPGQHDGVRFRFDRPSIPGVPSVEVYRPCPTDESVCPDLPDELERFDAPYPVVVVFHGFTASKELHRMNTQAFAEAGYLAIGVNGTHPDLGPLPSLSAPNVQRTANGEDTLTWLHAGEHPIAQEADLDRVAFAGHSQGSAAARAYQGDPRVHTIIAWDGGDAAADENVDQPMMFQRTDGGFATPSSYSQLPDPEPRLVGYRALRERDVDVLHFTGRATTHVDWNGNGGPGNNRLFELTSNYYNLAWLDRYLKGRLVVDEGGEVVTTGGRTELEERAYRQALAQDGYERLIADTFDDSADRHNISQGFFDPVQAVESGEPLFGGNVPYRIEGLEVGNRFSYYYPSVCFLSVPDYLGGASGVPGDPVAARADSTTAGDLRLHGCPETEGAGTDPGAPDVALDCEACQVQVRAGESGEAVLSLGNAGDRTAGVVLDVTAPHGWATSVSPGTVSLAPGDVVDVRVAVSPPRNARGTHDVEVTASVDGAQVASAPVAVEVVKGPPTERGANPGPRSGPASSAGDADLDAAPAVGTAEMTGPQPAGAPLPAHRLAADPASPRMAPLGRWVALATLVLAATSRTVSTTRARRR